MGTLEKRSMTLNGHATSLALEPQFWAAVDAMATGNGASAAGVIERIDAKREGGSLASAVRVAALEWALKTDRSST